MNLVTRIGLTLFSLLTLSQYYYLYFFDFDKGVSHAPRISLVTKLASIAFLCLLFFRIRINTRIGYDALALSLFYVWALALMSLKSFFATEGGLLFLNSFLSFLPFMLLKFRADLERIYYFLDRCCLVVCCQVALDFSIYVWGQSLWENRAFIGGLGNPSSFGLICNLLIAYLLLLKTSRGAHAVVAILAFGVFMTSSMTSVLILSLIVTCWIISSRRFVLIGVVLLGIIVLLTNYDSILSSHVQYKISSLLDFLGSGEALGSRSVSLRVEIHQILVEQLSNDFVEVLTQGYSNFVYYAADSQFVSYFGSFGAIGILLFLLYLLQCIFVCFRIQGEPGTFFRVTIIIFSLMFITNRILDYFPLPMFFFLFIAFAKTVENCDAIEITTRPSRWQAQ